jgi:Zn-dependent peptidase ImmA (M78 family)
MAPSGVYGNAFDGMGYIYIYLDPCLELQPQKNVEFTVAHEFAHVVLNHTDYLRTGEKEKEADADALAKAWGFTRPTG